MYSRERLVLWRTTKPGEVTILNGVVREEHLVKVIEKQVREEVRVQIAVSVSGRKSFPGRGTKCKDTEALPYQSFLESYQHLLHTSLNALSLLDGSCHQYKIHTVLQPKEKPHVVCEPVIVNMHKGVISG